MKNWIFALSISAAVGFSACGDKKNNDDLVAPAGMTYVDITEKSGFNLNVLTPDSTVGELETTMESFGAYKMSVGKNFQISIEEAPTDIKALKDELNLDDVKKVKKLLVDNDTSLVWESGIEGMSEFHFRHNVKAGERSYTVRDIEGETAFTQAAIEGMYKAAKMIREGKKPQESK